MSPIVTQNTALDVMHDSKGNVFPFMPVLKTESFAVPSPEQARRGCLLTFATDFLAVLKEEGCDPSEAFAVASLLDTLVREQSKVVDVSPDECDLVWKEES